jgi:hypothetical protein
MAKFLTELYVKCISDGVWSLDTPLCYESDIVGIIEVPAGFQTDFASVPRVPFIYEAFGDRAHREAVLHDYLYRTDSVPLATYSQANNVFFEAMRERGKGYIVSYGMYWGVVLGGWTAFHKKKVEDKLCHS